MISTVGLTNSTWSRCSRLVCEELSPPTWRLCQNKWKQQLQQQMHLCLTSLFVTVFLSFGKTPTASSRCTLSPLNVKTLSVQEKWGEPFKLWFKVQTKSVHAPTHMKKEISFVKILSHTSPILTGVPPRLGMHGRGQRSRHSGCETTRQSRHFSEILPNLILFPQGTHDSGLMTCRRY